VQRLRLRFAKRPPAVHLSHLELMSTWQRALGRTKLPVAFSGGFSARPRMSMPLALPVGVVSDDELIDVDMSQPVDVGLAMRVLQQQLPAGIVLLDGMALAATAPGLGEILGGARYLARVHVAAEDARARIADFEAASGWPVRRERKGRVNEVDLKTLLISIALDGDELAFTLRSPVSGTLRPAEVVQAVLGDDVRVLSLRKLQTLFATDLVDGAGAEDGDVRTEKETEAPNR
jgi:radical SAM-linked protein